ncbi:MAG: biopolymer transporter ExbD [Betaproteobacteria bacterium]|nr:biopolymer transporter ExbD [Betaproteobacteria bacterium]MDE2046981.1 biopolymer transporter ExbD [Betaproteobacteria bacterium]
MPAVIHRNRRRAVSEINMVPFIDVMLVLLIIFMVTAPLLTPGLVDLPSVGKAAQAPQRVVEVIVKSNESLLVRTRDSEPVTTSLDQLVVRVKQAQQGAADAPVVISADKAVRYDLVVRVLDKLKRAGVARVGLSVKTEG